jgi:hypothetical protein
VTLPATTALEDLRSLVLGDDPLDLQEQVAFGRVPERMVQEDQLHARTVELLHEQDLVGVATGQSIRRVNIQAIQATSSSNVPEPLERRPGKRGPAIADVKELQLGGQDVPVCGGAFPERGYLALDGMGVRLLL